MQKNNKLMVQKQKTLPPIALPKSPAARSKLVEKTLTKLQRSAERRHIAEETVEAAMLEDLEVLLSADLDTTALFKHIRKLEAGIRGTRASLKHQTQVLSAFKKAQANAKYIERFRERHKHPGANAELVAKRDGMSCWRFLT